MCLAVPAKVITIKDNIATAELEGVRVEASLAMLPDVMVGDYILIHAGYALQCIDEQEALITLEYFDQMKAAE